MAISDFPDPVGPTMAINLVGWFVIWHLGCQKTNRYANFGTRSLCEPNPIIEGYEAITIRLMLRIPQQLADFYLIIIVRSDAFSGQSSGLLDTPTRKTSGERSVLAY